MSYSQVERRSFLMRLHEGSNPSNLKETGVEPVCGRFTIYCLRRSATLFLFFKQKIRKGLEPLY